MIADPSQILRTKAQEENLHNLYLVEPNGIDESGKTIEWTHHLVQNFIDDFQKPKSIHNHSDVLILKQTEENKAYQMSDIDEIFSFLHYKAQEYKRKILIIEKASALSINHINKLLKTFEEPPIELTIFLVNATKKQLLPTLYSRAIQLKVRLIPNNQELKINTSLEDLSFIEFVQRVEKENWKISDLMLYLYDRLEKAQVNQIQSQKVQDILHELDEAMTFNNSYNTQLFKIYSCLEYTQHS